MRASPHNAGSGSSVIHGSILDRAISGFIGLLFPVDCPVCQSPSTTHSIAPLCDSCWMGIARMEGPFCGRCAKPIASPHAAVCGECLKREPAYTSARCYGRYDGALREAIHQLKFSGFKRLARPLGAMLGRLELSLADLIIPVPVGMWALRERGFNHCYYLGRELGRIKGMPIDSSTLYKRREIGPQVGLSKAARIENVRGAFGMRRKLNGERVLLVDDVITTGATVSECSKVIMKAGAGEVFVAALARA